MLQGTAFQVAVRIDAEMGEPQHTIGLHKPDRSLHTLYIFINVVIISVYMYRYVLTLLTVVCSLRLQGSQGTRDGNTSVRDQYERLA